MAGRLKKVAERQGERRTRQTLDECALAGIVDQDLERTLIDHVDARLRCRGADEDEVAVVNALPQGMRALYLSWTVEAEVSDGGFVRYFWNRAGQFAQDAVEAFEFFAAREHARLLREAIRVYGEDCGTTHVTESWRLQVLEDHYFQLEESLSALRIAKVRSDPRAFCEN